MNTVFERLQVFDGMKAELVQTGMKTADVDKVVEEMREATKHAAEALQIIRRAMGDVHGTRPALRRTVYDSIKWSSAICGLLEGQM